jgi:NADPH2:quinone reductase
MKAVVIREPGGVEVLELRDVLAPEPTRGEVRVRIRATAVNRADLLQRMGAYPAPPGSPKDIPGLEFAGEVDALGEGVFDLAVGDRVFGLAGGGTYAEKIVVPARTVARMPSGRSFMDGAAIPEAFLTAYDALVAQGGLRSGERVLVSAVGSGVGTAAVQIARALGARPFGTARSRDKIESAKKLGLIDGVVPEGGRFAEALSQHGPFDVIIELVGGAYVAEDLACVATRGRIVVVGLMAGTQVDLNLGSLLMKRVTIVGTTLRARPLEEKIAVARMLERNLAPLFEEGKLRPVVDRILPLAQAREAHTAMASNETFGKIVLEV